MNACELRSGERHASTTDAVSEILRVYRHEILKHKSRFLDVFAPNRRPMDFLFLLVLEQKWSGTFYISRCFSLTMFIFYMYDFSTVFTFIFIVTVL